MSPRRSSARRLAANAAVFSALGDETRLRLVDRMCDAGPASIVELTEGSGVSRQAVTKHLRVLEGAGLVRSSLLADRNLRPLQPEVATEESPWRGHGGLDGRRL